MSYFCRYSTHFIVFILRPFTTIFCGSGPWFLHYEAFWDQSKCIQAYVLKHCMGNQSFPGDWQELPHWPSHKKLFGLLGGYLRSWLPNQLI